MGVDKEPVQIDRELERLRADVDTALTLLEEVAGPYEYWCRKYDVAKKVYEKADAVLAEYERDRRAEEAMGEVTT